MKNLKINARITEVADTATRLLILFKRHPTIGDDTILKPLFAEIGTLAEQLSEVIKSDKTISRPCRSRELSSTRFSPNMA